MQRELGIRLRIFMRAIEQRVGGQLADPVEAVPELLGFAFEHAAAPQREDAVADESHVRFGDVIGDMAVGVARDIDHACLPVAQHHAVAIADHAVDPAQFVDFLRGDDGGSGRIHDRRIAARMVGMPVRIPDLRDLPALGAGLFQIFRPVGSIDRRGFAAGGVMQQETVIVGQARELVNFEHDGEPRRVPPYRKGPLADHASGPPCDRHPGANRDR